MPQSYSALWVHIIWSTKNREPILVPTLRKEVFDIIHILAKEHEIYLDRINGIDDHVHLLVRLRTDQTVSDVVKTIKGNSWEHFKELPDKYINWQDGFAAFSVSPGNLKAVRNYIDRQQIHHKNKSFTDELKEIKAGIRSQE